MPAFGYAGGLERCLVVKWVGLAVVLVAGMGWGRAGKRPDGRRLVLGGARLALDEARQTPEKERPASKRARLATEAMARTVLRDWPAGVVSTIRKPGEWSYEEGVLLDGMAAEWSVTRDPGELAYVKASVDKYVGAEGTITMGPSGRAFPVAAHTLDDLEMGRAVLFVYRQTKDEKYAKAARFLHDALKAQPRTASGGYWHKQIYPNQMWLDGAYMAEPFRAEYAATFGAEPGEWADIARQFTLMDEHMRDPKTGLLRHGWDESKQMAWADKTTGLSPEVWARAMGWYCMALVDVLDWVPAGVERKQLMSLVHRTLTGVEQYESQDDHLWWQVMDHAPIHGGLPASSKHLHDARTWARIKAHDAEWSRGNFPEASASAMFVYALAKAARKGYLEGGETTAALDARSGWEAMQQTFVKACLDGAGVNGAGLNGARVLTGTVKAAGLGGTPYRSGSYNYYVREAQGDQDAKGVGAYLLAGSEVGR